jgi:hypothetical protein
MPEPESNARYDRDRLREVGMPSSPVVNDTRSLHAQALSDLVGSDELFHVDALTHCHLLTLLVEAV